LSRSITELELRQVQHPLLAHDLLAGETPQLPDCGILPPGPIRKPVEKGRPPGPGPQADIKGGHGPASAPRLWPPSSRRWR